MIFQILLCVDVAATSAKSVDMCRFLLDEVSIISCAFCISTLLQILLETIAAISYFCVYGFYSVPIQALSSAQLDWVAANFTLALVLP